MKVLFDNIVNARDLGGLIGAGGRPIKPHRLLRTAHLHDATDTDLHRLQQEYHLAKIFDFRSLGEAELRKLGKALGIETVVVTCLLCSSRPQR